MLNRSELMKSAWTIHRQSVEYVSRNPYLAGTVVTFSMSLKEAWRRSKADTAKRSMPAAVAARVEALKAQILNLDCKSFRYSISAERRELEAELQDAIKEAA